MGRLHHRRPAELRDREPALGQIWLVLSYFTLAIPAVVSPLAITGTLVAALALVRGRWPDARSREDARLFVVVLACAMLTIPKFGTVWFHRPVCTNYIYPLTLQLGWLIPFRFLAVRTPSHGGVGRGTLATAGMIALGFLAGAGNEHTAPGLVVAAGACLVIAWRRDRRLPAWAITGVLALGAGAVFLITAPGQSVRYQSIAAQHTLFSPLFERGLGATVSLLWVPIRWALPCTLALVLAAWRARWPRLSREARCTALIAVAAGGTMIATCLLSPKTAPRLFAAPAMLFVVAMGAVVVGLGASRPMRSLHRASALTAGAVAGYALVVQVVTGLEFRQRLARLEATAPGETVHIAPYTFARPRMVSVGDDFRQQRLVEAIEQELGGITIDWR